MAKPLVSVNNTVKVIDSTGKVYSSLLALIAGRNTAATIRNLDKEVEKYYKTTGSAIEKLVINSLGASRVADRAGSGAIFDFIRAGPDGELVSGEVKAITIETAGDQVTKAREIGISSSGIRLYGSSAGTPRTFITGLQNIELDTRNEYLPKEVTTTTDVKITNTFVNRLLNAKTNEERKNIIFKSKFPAAKAIKENLLLKAADIRVVFTLNNSIKIASFGFTEEQAYNNKGVVIRVSPIKSGLDQNVKNAAEVNMYITEATVRNMINKIIKTTEEDLIDVGAAMANVLAKDFAYLSREAVKTLGKYNISFNLEMNTELGSSRVADATKIVQAKSGERQKFLSNVQWTMLTQKRLGETMKRIGDPAPPDIKERSGRFRASVEVVTNYRSNMISYTYNPLYRGLEHYGYHPELQIERAIREVAQNLYTRHFTIVRKGSLA